MLAWIDSYQYARLRYEERLREAAQSRQAVDLTATIQMLSGRLAGLRALLRRALWGERRRTSFVRPQFGLHAR